MSCTRVNRTAPVICSVKAIVLHEKMTSRKSTFDKGQYIDIQFSITSAACSYVVI